MASLQLLGILLVPNPGCFGREQLVRKPPIPLRESLVCELILKVAKTHDTFNLSGQYTTSGQEAIAILQDCIFGSNLKQSPFLQLVCCQSYEKASIARLACIRLLERAVTPANCYTLLHLANHCRLPSLAAAAVAVTQARLHAALSQAARPRLGRGF
ncbi:hypothetical protein WJX75_008621 [Coccomyxa subellipsoidea]|uniref:Uncharacterized protein n=1 Tax=Coccomyxa subellipsoidea TaxID=248742 RepID=A0ABR2YBR1_9CHLO